MQTAKSAGAGTPSETQSSRYDAVVVGAGFAGIGMLHELRAMGLNAIALDSGEAIGGTWHWNRYPGARTDSEGYYYCFSVYKDLLEDWEWSERYPGQAETQGYLEFVVDRFGLREHIQLRTVVTAARYDESSGQWQVDTDGGETLQCRYFISGTGYMSAPHYPDIPGLDRFEGPCVHTARWPMDGVDYRNRRVGIIGAGASAIQALPVIAEEAAHVTLFQRTPNYVFPAGNKPMDAKWWQEIRSEYPEIWRQVREHPFSMPFKSPCGRLAVDTAAEERERIFQEYWDYGGFRFFFETFDDLQLDPEANAHAAEFVRNRIRDIVDDPETAELLCPKDYPLFGKRPPAGHHYYETFNRDNVTLVDVKHSERIEAVTPQGLQTDREHYEFDVLILATGFAAVTGSIERIDIRGRDNLPLKRKWDDELRCYLGLLTHGFPNFFMITGPQTPFANLPVLIEDNMLWIRDCIRHMEQHRLRTVEPLESAERAWAAHNNEVIEMTVMNDGYDAHAWFLGTNIPGKKPTVLSYFGGANNYMDLCRQEAAEGYPKLQFETAPEAESVA